MPAKNTPTFSDRQQLMYQFTRYRDSSLTVKAIRTSHLPAPGDPITLVRRRLLRHTGINVGATMIKMGLKRCSPRVRGTDMARNSGITLSAHQKQMASWGRSTPVMLLARIQVMSGCIDQNSRLPASPTQLSKLLN